MDNDGIYISEVTERIDRWAVFIDGMFLKFFDNRIAAEDYIMVAMARGMIYDPENLNHEYSMEKVFENIHRTVGTLGEGRTIIWSPNNPYKGKLDAMVNDIKGDFGL